jgi:hypothetical protein
MKAPLAALALAIAAAVPNNAAAGVSMIGDGQASCGSWTDARRFPDGIGAEMDEQWVVGFISGVAYQGPHDNFDPLRGLDGAAVWAWIDNYCRSNPLDNITNAALAFIQAHPR